MDQLDLNVIEGRIDECLGTNNDEGLRYELEMLGTEEVAAVINRLHHGKKKVFRLLPVSHQQEVLWQVNNHSRKLIVASLTVNELLDLLRGMDSDDASDVAALVPERKRKVLLANLPKDDSRDIRNILSYGQDTAGGIMQTELIKVPESFTVSECVGRIRRLGKEMGNAYVVFVTGSRGELRGYVPIEQLIVADPQGRIRTLVLPVTGIPVEADQEEAAHLFKDADLPVLPVVDSGGKLVGRITADDIVDVLEQEQSEDIYRLAGVGGEESIFDPAPLSARRRLLWLTINMATAIMAAATVSLFQGTIQKTVILAAYMPIVAGMGGNAVTQIITIIVRSIALKEVETANLGRILAKETTIGIINGIALGLVIGIASYLYNRSFMLGVVVALAMLINLLIAGISGTLIPIILKKMRLDPALSSCVIATTCTDVGGFFAFLGLASLML